MEQQLTETSQKKTQDDVIPRSKHHRIEPQVKIDDEVYVEGAWVSGNEEEQEQIKIYSIKFNHDDKFIAAACENGQVQIYNVNGGNLSYTFQNTSASDPTINSTVSYVRWRPQPSTYKTNNVFLTCDTEGQIKHWHLASKKCLSTIVDEVPAGEHNKDPCLYAADYNRDATKFAVCGANTYVSLYDEETLQKISALGGECFPPAHTNRVYCVKFAPDDPNVIYSGGWDRRVIRWDLREGKPDSNGIQGPMIAGDSIDIYQDYILTASWTETNQLQYWDVKSMKLMGNIDWDQNIKHPSGTDQQVQCYAGQFSKQDGTLILAGGSQTNEVKLFDRCHGDKDVVGIYDMTREVNCVEFSNLGGKFAVSGGDGYVRLFNMDVQS